MSDTKRAAIGEGSKKNKPVPEKSEQDVPNVPNIAELRKNAVCFVPHKDKSNHIIDSF